MHGHPKYPQVQTEIFDFLQASQVCKSKERELSEVLEQLLFDESFEEPRDLSSLVDEVVSRAVADRPLDGRRSTWFEAFGVRTSMRRDALENVTGELRDGRRRTSEPGACHRKTQNACLFLPEKILPYHDIPPQGVNKRSPERVWH